MAITIETGQRGDPETMKIEVNTLNAERAKESLQGQT